MRLTLQDIEAILGISAIRSKNHLAREKDGWVQTCTEDVREFKLKESAQRGNHMRHRIVGSIVLVLILAFGMYNCAQLDKPSFSTQDAASVRANLDTFMIADPIDEPETFFSQFTEDVYWAFLDLEKVGMQSLRSVEWCHALLGEITADRVEGSGDLAYARGTYRLSLDCGGDAPIDSEGVFLSAHRRQQDGTWRIESMILHDL